MRKCPKCNNDLVHDTVVKYTEWHGVKVVGAQSYCPNMRCDFEK